jgi:hypothetical protein
MSDDSPTRERLRRQPPARTRPDRSWRDLHRAPTLRTDGAAEASSKDGASGDGSYRLDSVEAISVHAVRTAFRVADRNLGLATRAVGNIYQFNRDSGGSVGGGMRGAARLARDAAYLYALSLGAPFPIARHLFGWWGDYANHGGVMSGGPSAGGWRAAPEAPRSPAPPDPPQAPATPQPTYEFTQRTGQLAAGAPRWASDAPEVGRVKTMRPLFRDAGVHADVVDDRLIALACTDAAPGEYGWIAADGAGVQVGVLLWKLC